MQDFAETYRAYSDDEISRLHREAASLTEEARYALLCEIQRRGLQEKEILQIQEEQAKHVTEFDKEQKQEGKDRLFVGLMSILEVSLAELRPALLLSAASVGANEVPGGNPALCTGRRYRPGWCGAGVPGGGYNHSQRTALCGMAWQQKDANRRGDSPIDDLAFFKPFRGFA